MQRRALSVLAVLALAGCVRPPGYQAAWDGRRGYDGSGDYGYNLDAPREALAYEERARSAYLAPGPANDPWGPYIREAATRFALPDAWIRAVMHQESGERTMASDGSPITSTAGAMGLMQVMPGTYDILKRRYRLGPDPFDPRSNIMAGAAYLKEMHGRFGAPAFLAAYNAGPDRVAAYLAGQTGLPDETVNYVASIGPRIGMAGQFGPGASDPATFGAGSDVAYAAIRAPATGDDAAYAGGGMTGAEYWSARR